MERDRRGAVEGTETPAVESQLCHLMAVYQLSRNRNIMHISASWLPSCSFRFFFCCCICWAQYYILSWVLFYFSSLYDCCLSVCMVAWSKILHKSETTTSTDFNVRLYDIHFCRLVTIDSVGWGINHIMFWHEMVQQNVRERALLLIFYQWGKKVLLWLEWMWQFGGLVILQSEFK